MHWIDLSLPPDARLVGVARTTAAAASRTAGLDPEQVEDIKTCVSEALTNAITAQRQAAVADPVLVRVGINESTVTVEVNDRGEGLREGAMADLDALPDAVEDLPEGGFGLPVIHALADEVDIAVAIHDGRGTRVRMLFHKDRAAV